MSKVPQSVASGQARNRSFDPNAQLERVSNGGLSWSPLGAASAPVLVGKTTPVMVYSATSAWVAFGNDTVAAPTGAANGIPVPANTPVVYNSGPNTHVIGSAGTVFVYSADLEVSQLASAPQQLENAQEDLSSIPSNERPPN